MDAQRKRSRQPEVIVIDDSEDNDPVLLQAAKKPQPLSFRLVEHEGDLFTVDSRVSLAHCVARDLRLGKGIATEFKRRFGGLEDMHAQKAGVGGLVVLSRETRYIYGLVTKEQSSRCLPTLGDLRRSLEALRERMQLDGVTKLACPRLACGLDKLDWYTQVLPCIVDVFKDTHVSIDIYAL